MTPEEIEAKLKEHEKMLSQLTYLIQGLQSHVEGLQLAVKQLMQGRIPYE